jgi:hypothetical protein
MSLELQQVKDGLKNSHSYEVFRKDGTPCDYKMGGLEAIQEELTFVFLDHKFEYVQQYGGEGLGDEYWYIFSVEANEGEKKFYKIPGWYQSHYGSEMDTDDTFEVEQKEVVVKQWLKVKE